MTMKIKNDNAAIERCRKVLTLKFYLKFIHVISVLKLISMDDVAKDNYIASYLNSYMCIILYP